METRMRLRSWTSFAVSIVRAALVAIPIAVAATFMGLLIVLLAEVPRSGLFAHVPAMLRDPGTLVTAAICAVAGIAGFRRPTPVAIHVWSRRHGVPPSMAPIAARELQRLRSFRTAPAVLGYAAGSMSAPAANVALNVLGPDHPASQALLDAASEMSWSLLTLAGYVAGVILAEVTRRPPVHAGAGARLETRRPRQYLTTTARRLPALLAAWVAIATVAGTLAGRVPDWRPALIAAALPGAVALIQHHIVRRSQPVTAADALALDDTLRSSAAHALSGSVSALLLAWVMNVTSSALLGTTGGPGLIWIVLVVAGSVGVFGLWAHYGSAHRGRRPLRAEQAGSAGAPGL